MNDESTIKPQPTSEEINQSSEVKAERRRDRTNVPPGLPGVPAEIPIEERPLSLCDKPYLIDELGIKNLLLKLNPSHLDKKIDIIDAYIKNEITQRKWKPNIKSYVKVFSEIKETLKRLTIHFKTFFNEKSLYDDGKIDRLLSEFEKKNLSYEK